jgi:very-short-patch-repair endonuclease
MATFASHPKAIYWSKWNDLKPHEVALNSHKKYWFDCVECGHEFDAPLKEINLVNRWCSYCANKKICGPLEKCETCIAKSFASVPYSENWSSLNKEKPEQVFKNSHKKYFFNCPKCSHTFSQCLSHITRGNTCTFCGKRALCTPDKECRICFEKSFASVERSKHFSKKNTKQPSQIFKSTAEKFIFDCDKCGSEFQSKLSHITDGSWCPHCRYKTEDIVYVKLKMRYSSLQKQYKVDWCKDKKHLPFDFVIEERKVIIELDGEQHWVQVAKWKTPEHNRARDLYKMKCANEQGFSVIRIVQEDVHKNKYDWLTELCRNIDKIALDNRVQNIYMCKMNEYKDYDI